MKRGLRRDQRPDLVIKTQSCKEFSTSQANRRWGILWRIFHFLIPSMVIYYLRGSGPLQ